MLPRIIGKAACVLLLAFLFFSCNEADAVQIWTDRPEFALYGEYYNNSQNQYKVNVRYMELPANELSRSNSPDIIIASHLKNSSMQSNFKNINNVFGTRKLSRNIFYPLLLAAGRIERNQFLLPVSFNIPALIFSRENEQEMSNQFTVSFDEIKEISLKYNIINSGSYTRMGFSPLWNNRFLFTASVLKGASFREDTSQQGQARSSNRNPLIWDSNALEQSMLFINNWTGEINTSSQMEEDFTFKYFYESPERLILSGRIFFSFIESSSLFLIGSDVMPALDYRWIMEEEMIPLTEDMIMLGISKWAKSETAARAFILWFFNMENQRQLLDYFRSNKLNENIFGICRGFSALSAVTEQVYPVFYPELLGRMPPSEYFLEPNQLPANWAAMRERVILPYLSERARASAENIYPLERRITDWIRMNR
ncbi:MAG: hypothetical protein FWC21_03220 [Treponema sp.]|nr:hypothetical protein [Treponema sp.]